MDEFMGSREIAVGKIFIIFLEGGSYDGLDVMNRYYGVFEC